MNKITQFFSAMHLFNAANNYSAKFLIVELIIIFVMIIIAIIIKQYFGYKFRDIKSSRILIYKLFNAIIACAILGSVLVFFQWQQIPYLSAKFLIFLLAIIFVIWIVFIVKFYFQEFKYIVKEEKQQQYFEKYLPKKKNK